MTVRRGSHEHFEAEQPEVADAVRAVLSRHPPYHQTVEDEPGVRFRTNVKPSWWLAGTDMTVVLVPVPGGTEIAVETKSEWFIGGDIFAYYDRYIREFLQDMGAELRRENVAP